MSDFESEEKFERSHAIEGRASVSSDAKSDHHHLASTAPPPNTSTIGAAVPLGPDLEAQSAIQEPSVPPRDPDIVSPFFIVFLLIIQLTVARSRGAVLMIQKTQRTGLSVGSGLQRSSYHCLASFPQ